MLLMTAVPGASGSAAAGPARSGPRPPVQRAAARGRRSCVRWPAAAGHGTARTVGGPLPVRRAPARAAGPARTGPGRCLTCIHLESISVMAVDGT